MKPDPAKSNMRKLANGSYLVRSQAGFKRAIREFFCSYQLEHVRDIKGYPLAYPSVVSFAFLYGWNEAQATCTPLNEYVTNMNALLADLAGA